MGTKLTNNDLAVLLAQRMGLDEEESRKFIEIFFNKIAENVSENKVVNVEGLGKFAKDLNDADFLDFIPDENLKDVVNKPFSYFEPQKIVDESLLDDQKILEVDLDSIGEDSHPRGLEDENPVNQKELEPLETKIPATGDNNNDLLDETLENSTSSDISKLKEDRFSPTELMDEFPLKTDTGYNKPIESNRKFWLILGCILSVLIIGGVLYLMIRNSKYHPSNKQIVSTNVAVDTLAKRKDYDSVKNIAAENNSDSHISESANSIVDNKPDKQVQTEVSKKVTIKPSQTLHIVAKEYLGNSAFWVYIYLKNKSKISNPNNVPSGTILELPTNSEYNLNANNTKSIAEAKRLGNELLGEFK